jgi:urocanate hydratase
MSRVIKAGRGSKLRCKSWRQEGLLRLLENNLENSIDPDRLIVYSHGKAARDWACYDRIVEGLKALENDETLVIQSGKPVAVFTTQKLSPRVVMASGNLNARWLAWEKQELIEKKYNFETFSEFEKKGLTMNPEYTAGCWAYIGKQGVSHGTYETLAAAANQHFDGTLKGRLVLTSGLGQMSGAQPLAITMNEGVGLIVEANPKILERRHKEGWIGRIAENLDEALEIVKSALKKKEAVSIGLLGNTAEVYPELVTRDITPDIVTDMTIASDPLAYIPAGLSVEKADRLRESNPEEYVRLSQRSAVEVVKAMLSFKERGAVVFEYGNSLRVLAYRGGLKKAFKIKNFVSELIRPLFSIGRGSFRWIALSGEKEDILKIDKMVISEFPEDKVTVKWMKLASQIPFEGLPARTAWLNYEERAKFGRLVNDMVGDGELKAPIGISRDNMDTGSISNPLIETEDMKDGSDAIADWPLLNALLNVAAGADLVAIHEANDCPFEATGMTIIADGEKDTEKRLERVLTVDPGIGVVRHADAGYEQAKDVIKKTGIKALMIK